MNDEIQIQSAPAIQFKRAPEPGVIEGWLVRYNEVDAHGEVFAFGAFRDSLTEIKASGIRPPLLWQHSQPDIVGSWLELTEKAEGVWGVARINSGAARGPEALALVEKGDLTGLSVGFITSQRNGHVITKATLHEGSLVSIPCASKARAKLKDFGDLAAFADALTRGEPLARKDAEFVARKAWPAATNTPDPDNEIALKRLDREIEAATARIQTLTKGNSHARY